MNYTPLAAALLGKRRGTNVPLQHQFKPQLNAKLRLPTYAPLAALQSIRENVLRLALKSRLSENRYRNLRSELRARKVLTMLGRRLPNRRRSRRAYRTGKRSRYLRMKARRRKERSRHKAKIYTAYDDEADDQDSRRTHVLLTNQTPHSESIVSRVGYQSRVSPLRHNDFDLSGQLIRRGVVQYARPRSVGRRSIDFLRRLTSNREVPTIAIKKMLTSHHASKSLEINRSIRRGRLLKQFRRRSRKITRRTYARLRRASRRFTDGKRRVRRCRVNPVRFTPSFNRKANRAKVGAKQRSRRRYDKNFMVYMRR